MMEEARTTATAPQPDRRAEDPGATRLFEGPGRLDQVVDLARGWFAAHPKGT